MNKPLPSIQKVTFQDLLVTKGLYDVYSFEKADTDLLLKLLYGVFAVDSYCVGCANKSVFRVKPQQIPFNVNPNSIIDRCLVGHSIFTVECVCSRDCMTPLIFTLLLSHGQISKVGQFPSHADLSMDDTEQYKGLLPSALFREYRKAIGLYAHGIGAGSYVYLRRIIEIFLIEEAHQKAKSQQPDWDEAAYDGYRVKEKIKALSDYLPDYFTENKAVYGIVSMGIHELSDEQCLQYFPVLRSFLEMVLVEMHSEQERANKKSQLASALQGLSSKLH